ncbi:MAG TPA: hypothetical protein VHE53_00840 [Patescibacteria group bacterium]|nr:hypothetical protein [Patescibacteria group bacterium]
MTIDQKETALRLVPKSLPSIHAEILVPDTWNARESEANNSYAFTMSPDQLAKTPTVILDKRTIITSSKDANKTLFQVGAIDNLSALYKAGVFDYAENLMKSPFMKLRGPLIRRRDTNNRFLFTVGGLFETGGTPMGNVAFKPKMNYMEVTGNERTDKLYIVNFETLVKNWGQYEADAKTLVQSVKLDPTF